MSLNQIYDNPEDDSIKAWQNYRFNNLNIQGNFSVDAPGANPGDILQLNGALNPTWVPFATTNVNPVDFCSAGFTGSFVSIPVNVITQLPLSSISTSGPIFNLTAQSIGVTEICSAIITCVLSSNPNSATLPIFQIEKISNAVSVELINMSPYKSSSLTNLNVTASSICPVMLNPGDLIRISATCANPSSTSPCVFVPTESSISIIRVA